jgi:hypothetical protein
LQNRRKPRDSAKRNASTKNPRRSASSRSSPGVPARNGGNFGPAFSAASGLRAGRVIPSRSSTKRIACAMLQAAADKTDQVRGLLEAARSKW